MQIDSYQLDATRRRFHQRTAERERNLLRIDKGQSLSVDTPERVSKFLARRGFSGPEIERLMQEERPPSTTAAPESGGPAEPNALERVLGISDLMGVAFLELGLQVARTVGRIWVGVAAGQPQGYGTGFLVSPRLLLTNHHVLGDAGVAGASLVEFDFQLGADGRPSATTTFALDAGSFHAASRELDYALVAVRAAAANTGRALREYGWNPLFEEEGKAIAAQWVNIIQHPSGGMKQLALRENRLIDVFDAFMHYQTDTAPGSSGSPVFNDRWEVIGLHHSGVWAQDAQGRILAVDGRPWTEEMGEEKIKWIANEGVRISRIIADLRRRDLDPAQRGLLDEALSRATPPRAPRPEGAPVVAAAAASAAGPVVETAADGTATWVIPLTVSVRLGGAAPTVGVAAVAGPGAEPAARPTVAGSAGQSPEAVLVAARSELGARSDVLGVRLGYVFRDGWITKERAIVVTVRRRRAPAALRETGTVAVPERFRGLPVEVANPSFEDLFRMAGPPSRRELLLETARLGEEIVYQPPAGVPLAPVEDTMRVIAHVSPDRGWPVLREFLAGTRRRLVVGMFDFGAPHVLQAVEAAAAADGFETLTLVMQSGSSQGEGTKRDDLPDEEVVRRLEALLGQRFDSAWVRLGRVRGWVASSYHIKVAVRDGAAFWLSSGNWQSSNQPDAHPLAETPPRRHWLDTYNREWHAVVEHEGLAGTFEANLLNDYRRNLALAREEAAPALPDVLLPGALFAPLLEERAAAFRYFEPFDETRRFAVRPLLTPDNFRAEVLALVRGAREQVLIQNQTFNAPRDGQDELAELIDAVLEKQRAGLDVRIIFRNLDRARVRENLEALQDRGFDMRAFKVHPRCHTKGVVADGSRVLLGSQNWSSDGVMLNRDASLLFDDAPLARYFAAIFEHDWQNLARRDVGSEALAPELADPSAPTPDGMVRLSVKDLLEMA